ncbi:MAG TPA: hypothetical protein VLM76_09845 [Patescibacteria group bacterium]|nr:hypothetical protein [Patescibacteria group bacterium]
MVAHAPVCLECGTTARRPGASFCGRCGLTLGDRPRRDATLPACPVCYREVDSDGLLPSPSMPSRRVALPWHVEDHDRAPVGDDDWLESLREGDRVRIDRWKAPYDLVRRYLVTGVVDAGRSRAAHHDSIVTAMTQVARWGLDATVLGDQPEWAQARAAVGYLIERYHRGRP